MPTHSLINYAHWRIVSPESSLLDVGCDGYIAQVWTGTARTPNVYEGRLKERTFETAFLEYGAMQNLVRASGRRVWYLNDPIEDNPDHTWADYRTNWESTLTASLLQPEVWRYEIMPWPERIFHGKLPGTTPSRRPPRADAGAASRTDYETELQAVITALGDMKQPPERCGGSRAARAGVGVLVSDTMMFQRGDPHPSDPAPRLLLRPGPAAAEARAAGRAGADRERAAPPGFLDRYKRAAADLRGAEAADAGVPPGAGGLGEGRRRAGRGGRRQGPVQRRARLVEHRAAAPCDAAAPPVRRRLGLAPDARGLSHVGKGVVALRAALARRPHLRPGRRGRVRDLARRAAEAVGLKWQESRALVLRRGPYVIAAGLDESPGNGERKSRTPSRSCCGGGSCRCSTRSCRW